jgi:hypothetical protein
LVTTFPSLFAIIEQSGSKTIQGPYLIEQESVLGEESLWPRKKIKIQPRLLPCGQIIHPSHFHIVILPLF